MLAAAAAPAACIAAAVARLAKELFAVSVVLTDGAVVVPGPLLQEGLALRRVALLQRRAHQRRQEGSTNLAAVKAVDGFGPLAEAGAPRHRPRLAGATAALHRRRRRHPVQHLPLGAAAAATPVLLLLRHR